MCGPAGTGSRAAKSYVARVTFTGQDLAGCPLGSTRARRRRRGARRRGPLVERLPTRLGPRTGRRGVSLPKRRTGCDPPHPGQTSLPRVSWVKVHAARADHERVGDPGPVLAAAPHLIPVKLVRPAWNAAARGTTDRRRGQDGQCRPSFKMIRADDAQARHHQADGQDDPPSTRGRRECSGPRDTACRPGPGLAGS